MAVDLLIIGAGPYGLAVASLAKHRDISYRLYGKPMDFWKSHMPRGMFLRSGIQWHMDPLQLHTLEQFLHEKNLRRDEVEPIPVEIFQAYGDWFQQQSGVVAENILVSEINRRGELFEMTLENGETVLAKRVVVAPGFRYFKNEPEELTRGLIEHRYSHTSDFNDLRALSDKACLILGGRQSAFETAALLRENGARSIDLVYRHATPQFAVSDWTWIDPLLDEAGRTPGWFSHLPREQQEDIRRRFWVEGRIKLEPWLGPRIAFENVKLHPQTSLLSWSLSQDHLTARLSDGEAIKVDQVILATGFKVDVRQLSFLSKETILPLLRSVDGYPSLDENFQSTIPGLYFTGLIASRDFGPFFGFVRACPLSAQYIVTGVERSIRQERRVPQHG
ncbi:MAG: NAD(P)-binding domain-containing protein [Acidobacteriia bacterium]|nr:NAD(P)-binding domain-containing protein [Terriglobia bacterium]